MKEREKFLDWLLNGEVGLSSKAMGAYLCGMPIREKWERERHPLDPADFNRCLKLLDAIPEFRDRLHECKNLSARWRALVERWDDVEQSFLTEAGYDWGRSERAPHTYMLMKEIGL